MMIIMKKNEEKESRTKDIIQLDDMKCIKQIEKELDEKKEKEKKPKERKPKR